MQVAIDYTLSNGITSEPNSYHYLDPAQKVMNPYQTAIKAIGSIVEPLSYGNKFYAYGFGGIPKTQKDVSHSFTLNSLNGDETTSSIKGLQNLIQTYQ